MRIKNKEELEHITVPESKKLLKKKKHRTWNKHIEGTQEPTWNSSLGPKQKQIEQQNKYQIIAQV